MSGRRRVRVRIPDVTGGGTVVPTDPIVPFVATTAEMRLEFARQLDEMRMSTPDARTDVSKSIDQHQATTQSARVEITKSIDETYVTTPSSRVDITRQFDELAVTTPSAQAEHGKTIDTHSATTPSARVLLSKELDAHSVTTPNASVSFLGKKYELTSIVASKDAHRQNVTVCTDSAGAGNVNPMTCDGSTLTRRDLFLGFDLSFLPLRARLVSAFVTVYVSNAAITDGGANLSYLGDAAQTWSETTIRCSDSITLFGTSATIDFGTTIGSKTSSDIGADAAARDSFRRNAGVGSWTIVLVGSSVTNRTIVSKEEAILTDRRPTLTITYEVDYA